MTTTLPYSVSTGSAFNAFDKLHGIKNYADWRDNMQTMLMSLRQWGLIAGSVTRPVPADATNITPQEVTDIDAFDLRAISAYQEIKYRVGDTAKSVLGKSRDPKTVWDILERRFGSRQEGLQESLINKLQKAAWDGKTSILTHRDVMFDFRTQLHDTGLVLTDELFHQYFTHSLPPSLDTFIMFYDDASFDVDLLCQRFVRWEARRDLRGDKFDKLEGSSTGGSMALFGQQSSTPKKGERKNRDFSNYTCYGCGKKGHLRRNCRNPTKKHNVKDDKPKAEPAKQIAAAASTSSSDMMFTAIVNSSVLATDTLTNSFYIDSGASAHLVPMKCGLRNYIKFVSPFEIVVVNNGKILVYGSSTV